MPLPDFIDTYCANIADTSSPEQFKRWAVIAAIAGALERRVWIKTRKGAVFPNLFTFLVSSPGIGKTEAINITNDLWRGTKKLHVAPKRISSAAVIDAIKEAEKIKIGGGGAPNYEFHSLLMPIPEFTTFLQIYDTDMLGMISDIYDCPAEFGERRRHVNSGKELEIIAPQLNILAGIQPGIMSQVFPEQVWAQGFTSRIIMIYAGGADEAGSLWGESEKVSQAILTKRFEGYCDLYGQFNLSDAAKLALDLWYKGGMMPTPEHSKLIHYKTRRILHALKLIMVSCVSRSDAKQIEVEDVTRGIRWLTEAEAVMPDIFREMVQKSDNDIITELHFAMWRAYMTNGQQPLHQSMVWNFLQYRVASEKIPRIVETAEKSHVIRRAALSNEHWIPNPKQKHGIE